MAVTLKEESILNEWSTIIEQGAGQRQEVLKDIQGWLANAEIPGGCRWSIEEVQSAGWLSKVHRSFLIVNLEQFGDYRIYIGIREYGIHLDCCRFLTVEPNFLKKWASERLTGFGDVLSAPKNILVHQDLRSWTTVVHHCVLAAVEEAMTQLKQDPRLLNRTSKGILEIW